MTYRPYMTAVVTGNIATCQPQAGCMCTAVTTDMQAKQQATQAARHISKQSVYEACHYVRFAGSQCPLEACEEVASHQHPAC